MNPVEDWKLYQAELRFREFAPEIRLLSETNVPVKECIDAYVYGRIITKEEALCQMIMLLSKNWGQQRAEYERLMMNLGPSIRPQE
jgi:hypothetical protein